MGGETRQPELTEEEKPGQQRRDEDRVAVLFAPQTPGLLGGGCGLFRTWLQGTDGNRTLEG